jgi:hypothetical protein
MSQITNVETLAEYAERHGLEIGRLRRLARNDKWPTVDHKPFKWGKQWAIDTDATAITLPDKSTRGTRRPDGRQRHIVYANTVELTAIVDIVGNDNVVNPRVAAKRRRDDRKRSVVKCDYCDNDATHIGVTDIDGKTNVNMCDGCNMAFVGNDVNE